MSSPITEVKARLVEIQIEVMTSLGEDCDAKAYFNHTQEDFPYWTNRIGPITTESEIEDFEDDTYTFIMRLVIGHLTEGYDGEVEVNLDTWIPVIIKYFNEREWLNTETTYPDATQFLMLARITSCTGLRYFLSSGIADTQVGTEFTLTCEFTEDLTQAYT